MNILFTICARAGSKGVKNKNIRNFNGFPLVYYTLAAYKLFLETNKNSFDRIDLAVNTDSVELIEQIKKTKIPFIHIKRKENLAGDFVSKIEVIRDTVKEVEALEAGDKQKYQIVIDLDLTSPLRQSNDIYGVVNALLKKSWADLAFSVAESRRSPFFNMVKQDDEKYTLILDSPYIARQQAPNCYDMNASIYAYKREFLMRSTTKRVFDGKAVIYKMVDTAVLDIDSEEDFELLEILARKFYEINPGMKEIEDLAQKLYREDKGEGEK